MPIFNFDPIPHRPDFFNVNLPLKYGSITYNNVDNNKASYNFFYSQGLTGIFVQLANNFDFIQKNSNPNGTQIHFTEFSLFRLEKAIEHLSSATKNLRYYLDTNVKPIYDQQIIDLRNQAHAEADRLFFPKTYYISQLFLKFVYIPKSLSESREKMFKTFFNAENSEALKTRTLLFLVTLSIKHIDEVKKVFMILYAKNILG